MDYMEIGYIDGEVIQDAFDKVLQVARLIWFFLLMVSWCMFRFREIIHENIMQLIQIIFFFFLELGFNFIQLI